MYKDQKVKDIKYNEVKLNGACAVTGLTVSELLMASHAKPWEIASNVERLDGEICGDKPRRTLVK